MKYKLSLSLKITLIVVFVSSIVIFSLTYFNTEQLKNNYLSSYSEKGNSFAQYLDVTLEGFILSDDSVELQMFLHQMSQKTPEVTHVYLLLPTNGEFTIAHADSNESLGDSSQYQQFHEFAYDSGHRFYLIDDENASRNMIFIAPINLSGGYLGTYEIILSMDQALLLLDGATNFLIFIAVVGFFLLLFIILYFLSRAVVNPIIQFRDVAKMVGQGNLDAYVSISSKDELGELANSFNQMTKDLKLSREKVEQYNKALQGLLTQKDAFIGQLGHDLKNPLTPLVALLPIIEEEEKDPKLKEHLRVIIKNVEYMRDLIFKTLELAKLRSSAIKFDIQCLCLVDEIESVLQSQQVFLKQSGSGVKHKVDKSVLVAADKLRLTEVFTNLISNAVKYGPKGGGTIIISAQEEGELVHISVEDRGIGLTEKQVHEIFDEFYRVERSGGEKESSGLGLSICKRIIELHGGRIWADSNGVGKGSIFHFTLNVCEEKNL